MRYNLLISAISVACLLFSCTSRDISSSCLDELDGILKMRNTYEASYHKRMGELKQLKYLHSSPAYIYEINNRLANEYFSTSLDTTVLYLNENISLARKMNDTILEGKAELTLACAYVMAGYHMEALDILQSYDNKSIPYKLKKLYFYAKYTFSGELKSYYRNRTEYFDKYVNRNEYKDSLLKYVEPDSFLYWDIKREEAVDSGHVMQARSCIDSMITRTTTNSHDYAKACFYYAYTFDNYNSRILWFSRSAIADITCAIKDYASLHDLARLLFEKGDIERAFRYTADYCLPDAIAYNGKLRPWLISRFFPELERAYVNKSIHQKYVMIVLIIIISAMLFLLILMTITLVIRHRALIKARKSLQESYIEIEHRNIELQQINDRLELLNESINESDKVKQEYIALFLGILSADINEKRQYRNHVIKYIRRGNEKYLVDEIEALPSIEEDIRQFYKMFDETFINLFPDFVEKFNRLLLDGEKIFPKGNDILSPELRIFALIKLGIRDSCKIASLLHYSANTIYNYRAKIKNKAKVDRDIFEDEVAKL